MIIKFFGSKKGKDAEKDSGPLGENNADAGKIEFINLVEPLTSIISR